MLEIVPITIAEANQFVRDHHRHHGPVVGAKFCIAVSHQNEIVGVAIVGRPVSRILDNGFVAEVTRCCTNGHKNAASKLYAACWRACRAMGYKKLITYTLKEEEGTSLVATGWKIVAESPGGSWDTPSRPRVDKHPLQAKLRWEAC